MTQPPIPAEAQAAASRTPADLAGPTVKRRQAAADTGWPSWSERHYHGLHDARDGNSLCGITPEGDR